MNAKDEVITEHRGLFQAIELPAGPSEVRYRYAPPYIGWARFAMWVALAVLLLPRRRR